VSSTGPVIPADDELGPPRRNGELVFEAPWEGRAFGLAVTLASRGRFDWADFRAVLVEETAVDDARASAGGTARPYYARWAAALERLLAERGWVATADLEGAVREGAVHREQHEHARLHGRRRRPTTEPPPIHH
jgi:nitrile hydratase accessory protein